MATEPLDNIGVVCEEHSPKPGQFTGQDPNTFIGKFVRLGFPSPQGLEHMWVRVERLGEQTQLEGILDNDPAYDTGYTCGDGVGFDVSEIEQVDDLVAVAWELKSTLDQFIRRVRGSGRGNEWVSEPKFQYLYVRYGHRYVIGHSHKDVLDIANVEVEEKFQGTGVFTGLVARLRKDYPGMHLYVENAAPAFQPLLLRLGFVAVPYESFFLDGEKNVATP